MLAHEFRRTDGQSPPGDLPAMPPPIVCSDIANGNLPVRTGPSAVHQRLRDRMGRMPFQRRDQRPQALVAVPGDQRDPPAVSVPVLSRSITPGRLRASKTSPPLTRMCRRAARPKAIVTASGVASPRAQGQVTIKQRDRVVDRLGGTDPDPIQERHRGHGQHDPHEAAGDAVGELHDRRPVAAVLFDQLHQSADAGRLAHGLDLDDQPRREVERAGVHGLPGPTAAGCDSPVSKARLTDDSPSRTLPSAGIESPARTSTRSPGRTASIGTSTTVPLSSRRAVVGVTEKSSSSESLAQRLLPPLQPAADQQQQHEHGQASRSRFRRFREWR